MTAVTTILEIRAVELSQHKPFDATAALAAVRQARAERKRRCTWGKSRLTPHRAELVKLRAEGASFGDIAYWLRKNKRIKVDRSTVRRYLAKQHG